MEDEFERVRDNVRARLRDLRPIEGIAAIHGRVPATLPPQALTQALPQEELLAFQDAGWQFVSESQSANAHQRRLFLDADGHVKIDAGALNLRFRPDADPDSIQSFLTEHALHIRRRLGFAPNLFLVAGDAGGGQPDSVELARSLTDEDTPLIIYAEPVLIEGAGPR